ncbi:hypothetical protein E3N88_33109 [Mikania micrantha]|uniref:Uncharacterized protein n=1 Tax=Mikania micrantha TaxID=192012 RepID=A0A5N6MAC7_9ASTR|nr:hypothetical protein E3N88_33109 [Mikania micrantha]
MVWISHVVIAMIRYIVSFIYLNEKFEWKKSSAKVSQMESGDVLIIGAMLLIRVQSSYSIYQEVKTKTKGETGYSKTSCSHLTGPNKSRRWSKRRQGETGYSKKSGFHLTIPVKWIRGHHDLAFDAMLFDECSVILLHLLGWLFSYPVASNVMVGWVKVENKMCGQCQKEVKQRHKGRRVGYYFELPDCSVLLRHFVLHLTSLPQAVKKEVKVKTKVEMWYSKTSCFHLTIPVKIWGHNDLAFDAMLFDECSVTLHIRG